MGQLIDAPFVAQSWVTQIFFGVLAESYHHFTLTVSFQLVSFFTLMCYNEVQQMWPIWKTKTHMT